VGSLPVGHTLEGSKKPDGLTPGLDGQMIDKGGDSPNQAAPIHEQKELVLAVLEHGVVAGLELPPLLCAEWGYPNRIIPVGAVGKVDKATEILLTDDGSYLH